MWERKKMQDGKTDRFLELTLGQSGPYPAWSQLHWPGLPFRPFFTPGLEPTMARPHFAASYPVNRGEIRSQCFTHLKKKLIFQIQFCVSRNAWACFHSNVEAWICTISYFLQFSPNVQVSSQLQHLHSMLRLNYLNALSTIQVHFDCFTSSFQIRVQCFQS